MKNAKTDFWKVMGLGDIDYEFNLNLSEPEAKLYKFDIDQTKSLKDCKNLLQIDEVKEKISISSKNNLVNLLLFINKTNQNKIFSEFLSLNCLFLNQDMAFIKEKIKQDFDENFLFLIESNIKQPCKFKLNINVQNKQPKSFEMELQASDKKVDDKKPDDKKPDDKKQDDKKPDDKKPDDKKPDDKKPDDKKPDDKKPDDKKPDDKKPDDKKPDDKKPDDNKPKQGYIDNKKSIDLPSVAKPEYVSPKDNDGVEGKEDMQAGLRVNLLSQLKYEFENCDYIFIDLNKFINYSDISLGDLYDFLYNKIIHLYLNTSIVLIFPALEQNFKTELLAPLVDLITISDIVIYDKRDAQRLCTLLGYKVEDKNFEVRFMFLKELKRGKYKPQKTSLFLDDFHKLTVVMQETESNLIIFHNEFNFEIGFKLDFFKTVTNNYEFLKYVFYGGFFSRVVQNKPFDIAFQVGLETFRKMLDILHNNQPLPDDPDFFLIKNKKAEKKEKLVEPKQTKKSHYPQEMSSNSPSNKFGSKAGYMSSSDNMDDSYGYGGISPKNSTMNNNPNKLLEIEQKKLLTILEANEKIQQKLNKLLSMSPGSKQLGQYSDEEYGHTKLGKKLPGIRGGDSNPFSKMAKASYKSSYERKKNLKPISKETYDRLTGVNKLNNYYDPMSYSMGFIQNKALTKEEQYEQMKQLSQMNQNHINQPDNKPSDQGATKSTEGGKTEEKKKDEPKKDEKSPSPQKKDSKNMMGFDMSKIDPAMLQSFMMMTQGMNPYTANMGGVSPQNSQTLNKKHPFHVQRIKRELEPVCNLGYILQPVDKEKELRELEDKNKKKFKGPDFFDNKHNKSKFKYLEEQKKDIHLDEINKSVDERGRRDDYDDFKRSQEKAEREKQRIENERLAKEKAEKEKKDKEQKEKEQKEKEKKEKETKKEEKKVEEKPEEKKEEKKEEAKKEEKK